MAERSDKSNVWLNKVEGPAEIDSNTVALGEEGLDLSFCSMYMRNDIEVMDGLPSTARVQQGLLYK